MKCGHGELMCREDVFLSITHIERDHRVGTHGSILGQYVPMSRDQTLVYV